MIEDRSDHSPLAPRAHGAVGNGSGPGVEDDFRPEIVDLAEAGLIDGFLLPDELQELCRAVLDHVEQRGIHRT